jgi:hypothetical protein
MLSALALPVVGPDAALTKSLTEAARGCPVAAEKAKRSRDIPALRLLRFVRWSGKPVSAHFCVISVATDNRWRGRTRSNSTPVDRKSCCRMSDMHLAAYMCGFQRSDKGRLAHR